MTAAKQTLTDPKQELGQETSETAAAWCVYMVETVGGRLYTGITNNIERRWQAHCSGKGAKFFRSDPPASLAYLEAGHDRSSAAQREWQLKGLERVQKLALVAQTPRRLRKSLSSYRNEFL